MNKKNIQNSKKNKKSDESLDSMDSSDSEGSQAMEVDVEESDDENNNNAQDSDDDDMNFDIGLSPENINSKNLEKIIENDAIISFNSSCVRKKSNWGKASNKYKFDTPYFSPETLLNDIPNNSPKLNILLKKIEQLDKLDMKKHGKLFKHFIFSDLKSGTYGAKLLASALISRGMKLGYTANLKKNAKNRIDEGADDEDDVNSTDGQETTDKKTKRYGKIELVSDETLLETKFNNFYLLSSVSVYDQGISVVNKKAILKKFNQRPDNINGELARIIVMDSGFKEGIDLFDVKYVHIFEPSTVQSDQKQVIGRSTRTCGQKGLEFHPRLGWPLYVFVYDLSIPEQIQNSFLGAKTAMELYLKTMNINIRLFNFAHDLEKTTILGSVDYELNKNIHSFSIPNEDAEEDLPEGAEFVYNGGFDNTHHKLSGGSNQQTRLIVRDVPPIIISSNVSMNEPKRMNFQELKQHIREHYSDFSWESVKMENLCTDLQKGGSGDIIQYTPSQKFVRKYFTTSNPCKGIMLFYSVGTGKTCSAIATATNTFEREGYTILWVTRTTLKNDIWKNMFDQVCSGPIRNKITLSKLAIPDEQNKRMRLLSNSWRIRPMSYKQFSNLVSKQNAFYKTLVKINGEADPLRKTLLIIDEAHKLYGGGDLSSIERPDMNALHQAIMNSYELSGRDSVRLMLMTATPITEDPLELIKLINLMKPIREQMPTNFEEFSNIYLDNDGKFTDDGRERYLNDIAGYVSYLNREKDARQFAQPIIKSINAPIISDIEQAKRFDKKIVRDVMSSDINELKNQIIENNNKLKGELSEVNENMFSFLKKEICNGLEKKSLKQCETVVKHNIKQMVAEAKEEIKVIRDSIKQIRELVKQRNLARKESLSGVKQNTEQFAEDYDKYKNTLLYALKNNCGIKITGNSKLNELIKTHPVIKSYDEEIELYNVKIQELQNKLKLDVLQYKKKLEKLKLLLKDDLSELERSVIKMTIRDERKTQRNLIKLKRKDNITIEKELKDSIRKTEKRRKKKYGNIRKTIKERIAEEKHNEKEIEMEEKELRQALRKQGQQKEDFKHDLLNNLVNKYRGKIMDDLVDLDDELYAKQKEKEDKRIAKEMEKTRKKKESETRKLNKLMKKESAARERATRKAQKDLEKEQKKIAKELKRKTKKQQNNDKTKK
jgi:hypothetical protein